MTRRALPQWHPRPDQHGLNRSRSLIPAAGLLALFLVGAPVSKAQTPETFDIVLEGGRVMDPESGLDAVLNVGLQGDRIAKISEQGLRGRQTLDVSGLVVAPGFIDLHAHGQTNRANEFQVHDGVTTALELESGKAFLTLWLAERSGDALINFGASVGHGAIRWMAMEQYAEQARKVDRLLGRERINYRRLGRLLSEVGQARTHQMSDSEIRTLMSRLQSGLEAGGIGIGVPLGYYPEASPAEILQVYALAADRQVPIFSHVRDMSITGIQQAIANAAVTGASLHIVHLNSMALGQIDVALDMVAAAQKQGLDITTEVYPYTAASTSLESAVFDEGWRERLSISYEDLTWIATGERLTRETFEKYRKEGGTVIIHMMKPEWIEAGIRSPVTMIGSDGMPYAPGAHPRSAGTFSRVLGRYSRDWNVLPLMTALGKMTILPAGRLEGVVPSMERKGRIQAGCDADITVFDPERIIDTANFEDDLSFSEGIQHVLVNGTFVVKNGRTVEGARPGRPVLGRYRR
jgi:N-acyl-D-aspartate/D-glutamate deacylase